MYLHIQNVWMLDSGVRLHTSNFSPNHRAAICHLDHYFVYKRAQTIDKTARAHL